MKTKLLNVVKAIWPYGLTLIAGLYLVGILTGTIMALSKYKLTTAVHLSAVLKQLAFKVQHKS